MVRTATSLVLCGLLSCAGPAWSSQKATKRSQYTDEIYGFSIDAPRFPASKEGQLTSVTFRSPDQAGGVSNADVTVAKRTMSREAYLARFSEDMKRAGIKISSRRDLKISGRDAIEFDLIGVFPGGPKELRQFQLLVFDGDRMILATCIADTEKFRGLEAEFRAYLSSLRLETDPIRPTQDTDRRSRYVDETYGFRIDSPSFRRAGRGEICTPIRFEGLAAGGLVSKVEVTVGQVTNTRERYRATTLAQVGQNGFKLRGDRSLSVSGRDAVEFDFEGRAADGTALRVLTLTVFDKARMHTISCVVPRDAFPAHEAEFRASLASFRLIPDRLDHDPL